MIDLTIFLKATERAIAYRYAAMLLCVYTLLRLISTGAIAHEQSMLVHSHSHSAHKYLIKRRKIGTAFTAVMSSAVTLITLGMYTSFKAAGSFSPVALTAVYMGIAGLLCAALRPIVRRACGYMMPLEQFTYAVIISANPEKNASKQ